MARERTHGDVLALVESQSHVDLGICRLADQGFGGVGFGGEAHEACRVC